jgi:regulatory protein
VAGLQRALELAYRYLGHRDRTAAELLQHLVGKDVDPETAEQAVAELQRLDYVDDARFARLFAEDRRGLDAWGSQRIELRLRELGVAAEHIAAAVGTRDREQELDAAVAVLRSKLRAAPESDRERERALGLLVRRGYELELAHDAVREVARARL